MELSDLDLDVDWYHYVRKLEKRNGAPCGKGVWIVIYDPDSSHSYLGMLAECRGIHEKYDHFENIPRDGRRKLGGFGRHKSKWLGGLGANGLGKQAILERPDEIGRVLDKIPADRSKRASLGDLRAYMEDMTSLSGFAVPSASRLLVTKRPDLFASVNGANEKDLKEYFGFNPTSSVRNYIKLHDKLWSYPWFDSPTPEGSPEKEVWESRVALTDAFFYDADER
jgi:hypothetical protein